MILAGVIWTLAGPCKAWADSVITLGDSAALAEGARALFARNYDEGIRLTLEGLRLPVSGLQRAAALSNLCAGYVGAGQHDEAIAACTEAIAVRPGNWRAYNNRALAYLAQGRLVAARQDVITGLSLQPESRQLARVDAMVRAREPSVLLADSSR